MPNDNLIDIITNDTLRYIYKQILKKKNKQKLEIILKMVINIALKQINPYLYTIIILLLVILVVNSIQFCYYVKLI